MSATKNINPHGILFTDFYQLTMAQLYFRAGLHERPVQFDYFFRKYPDYGGHQAGYCIFAGTASLLDWMNRTACTPEDIAALKKQKGVTGERFFHDDFLAWFKDAGRFDSLTIEAVPEGRAVHPDLPLAVVRGPMPIAQILESALLNHLNYQTLIATKASRIAEAAGDQSVIDFGMRRGHGMAVNQAARAALIGGAAFSSNTGASCSLGYPPKGTHAHSMVQAFMALGQSELDAFRAYADLYPDDCILLVDTINTLESGVPNAIRVFEELKNKGHAPRGIRLDSGDLAYLSIQAHKILNEAGFPDVKIVLSNQLDEIVISEIRRQIRSEAGSEGINADELISRLVYGVGTSLITSKGFSALDGVYKLTAVQEDGNWRPAVKLSESASKIPNPGMKKLWRIYDKRGKAVGDMISLADEDPRNAETLILHHPVKAESHRTLKRSEIKAVEPLWERVYEKGKRSDDGDDIEAIRGRRARDLKNLDAGVKRLVNPHVYHVSLSEKLWEMKQDLIRRYSTETEKHKNGIYQ